MAPKFPLLYLLPNHMTDAERLEIEDQIPTITFSISEAQLVIGKVKSKKRAAYELRIRGVWTKEVAHEEEKRKDDKTRRGTALERSKRRKVNDNPASKEIIVIDCSSDSGPGSDAEHTKIRARNRRESREGSQSLQSSSFGADKHSSPLASESLSSVVTSTEGQEAVFFRDTIKVLQFSWYSDCLQAGFLLPINRYLVYEGRPIAQPDVPAAEPKPTRLPRVGNILSRVQADATEAGRGKSRSQSQSSRPFRPRPQLVHQSTSEHEGPSKLPPLPEYLKTQYSCQRFTPLCSPNDSFIDQLTQIKTARLLLHDEIGVRAYSSAVASLKAYPYTLTCSDEIVRLPSCGQKFASLYEEWRETGHIKEVDDTCSDPKMNVLNLFYRIWGVAGKTALEFYNKGWMDLDDVVNYGWTSLSRVQQIGLKYYDEFEQKIPRAEVESIGAMILEHANKICKGFQMVIVGGYRRGQAICGDVDVILSHPDENATLAFIDELCCSLEEGGWITHTLTTSHANTERGQTPVSWKVEKTRGTYGFDTLDKAFVAWQNPEWPTKASDLERDPKAKNPNVHRRVDIIISPWKTAGCAIVGWTGGTTFERDLRRYSRKVKNMKFDSSGIRSTLNGLWVDLEAGEGDLLAKEKRVFASLGLEWREPTERCTG